MRYLNMKHNTINLMSATLNLPMTKMGGKGNPLMQKPFSARGPMSKSPIHAPPMFNETQRASRTPPPPLRSSFNVQNNGVNTNAMPYASHQAPLQTVNQPNDHFFTLAPQTLQAQKNNGPQQTVSIMNGTPRLFAPNIVQNSYNQPTLDLSQISSNKSQLFTSRSRSSNVIPYHQRQHSPPLQFSDNIFENYKLIVTELGRKTSKINEVSTAMSKIRISQNQDELQQLNGLSDQKRHEANQLARSNAEQEAAKAGLIKRLSELEQIRLRKTEATQRNQKLGRPMAQLNSELNAARQEFETLRAKLAKLDIDAKMEFEAKYREKMEAQLLENVLEAAKKSENYDVQQLYAKLNEVKRKKDEAAKK